MRRVVLPVLACLLICFADADSAFSKGGRGRGGGGGRGRSGTQRGSGGGRRTVTPQNRGGGNRPTFDTQSRGNGNRPTFDTQRRGGGNRPTLDTQNRGNRPTLHRQSRGNSNRPSATGRAVQDGAATDSTQRLTGRDSALNVQQQNEERKLLHRQQIADHLRANADRNGNQNLYDTADRMEQRAQEQYARRMSRITGVDPNSVTDGLGDGVTDPGNGLVNDVTDGLSNTAAGDTGQLLQSTGDQLLNSTPLDSNLADALDGNTDLSRVLTREDRKLQHQLDVAQQLRDIAARNGNQNLVQTAQRMEDMAYSRYDRQLEKFFGPVSDTNGLVTNPLTDGLTDPLITDPVVTDPLITDPLITNPLATPDTLIQALEAATTP